MSHLIISLISIFASVVYSQENINFADIPCGNSMSKDSQREGKIVGGNDARPGEFPWLVSITRRGGHFCGGSLITNRHVLTAAHCICNGVDGFINPSTIKVTLGQHDLFKPSTNTYEKVVKVITPHPEYTCNKVRNDIAILELDSEVTWSDNVQPACLSRQKDDHDSATVAGWGWTSENNDKDGVKKTSQLQKAQVNILSNEVCRSWYKSQGKKTKIQETQMCAGHKDGGIDACWADSGGPLMTENSNLLSVVGIVSTGIGCARAMLPGIYTRISEYVPWIKMKLNMNMN